jgi:hypothetical protein
MYENKAERIAREHRIKSDSTAIALCNSYLRPGTSKNPKPLLFLLGNKETKVGRTCISIKKCISPVPSSSIVIKDLFGYTPR